jgi:hypothetical protein
MHNLCGMVILQWLMYDSNMAFPPAAPGGEVVFNPTSRLHFLSPVIRLL